MRILYLVAVLFSAPFAFAQDRGTIVGTITDTSGGAVPGAVVMVANPATGFSQSVPTASDGTFTFVYLPVGRYNLTVEKTGFKKADVTDVQVLVNTATRVETKLQVGAIAETVEVTGQ